MEIPDLGPAASAPQALAGAGSGSVSPPAPEPPRLLSTRLRGRRLLVARVAWAAAAAVLVGLYLLLLPACLAQLQTICTGPHCALVQPTPASARALRLLGFSVPGYAALTFALILLSAAVSFTVSGIIVWRKSDDWMALLVALAEVAIGTQFVPYLLETGHSAWQLLAVVVNAVDFVLLFLLFAIFPTGRFVPRWTRWLVVGWVMASVALVVSYRFTGELRFTAYALVWLAAVGCVAGAQVYRYRTVSHPRERAQTRWVVFGVAIAGLILIAVEAPTFLLPALGRPGSLYLLAAGLVYTLPPVLVSTCFGVAVLRGRLYDIDVIIHRTLVYTVVTGTLAAVYFGSVIVLQAGFHTLTGQGSPVAVVVSTLAIVALFQPVRGQIQAVIDRRFYRRKYDAARTLETFGATLRMETDLDDLRQGLIAVVEETMKPAHVSLWLAAPQQSSAPRPAQLAQGREE